MTQLSPEQRRLLNEFIHKKEIVDLIKSIHSNIKAKNEAPFVISMQSLIARLGMMISTAFGEKRNIGSCIGSLKFLCLTLLNNNDLFNQWQKSKINLNANQIKHSLKEITTFINTIVGLYDLTIGSIIDKYNLPMLNAMRINGNPAIKPDSNKPQPAKNIYSPNPNSKPAKQKTRAPYIPPDTNTKKLIKDGSCSLLAAIYKHNGIIEKGFFKKKYITACVNVQPNGGKEGYPISEIYGIFSFNSRYFNKKLKLNSGINYIELEYPPDDIACWSYLTVEIFVVFKIGILKRKTLSISLSLDF